MAALTVELDPVALREATSQAIMGILTPEVRERMLRQAIANLLAPSTDSWNRQKSPLELAFESATRQIAGDIVTEHLKGNADFLERLKNLARETADKVLGVDVNKMVDKMAEAFIASMRKDY